MRSPHRGIQSPGGAAAILACLLGVLPAGVVRAEPAGFAPTETTPDPPPRSVPDGPPRTLRPTWDLDGIYVWLGPTGAASRIAARWDSTFGADISVVRVREAGPVATMGATFGASRWTTRGGGRLWLDAVVGTRVAGRMIGATAGPILELADLARPRLGGSIGVWGFVGVTPFARVGVVEQLGAFIEVGVHIALPVIRR